VVALETSLEKLELQARASFVQFDVPGFVVDEQ
jgi:hypothetical protein